MRTRLSKLVWILIVALVSHGALPGVVVCVEATGQVVIETIGDNCCSGDTDPSPQPASTELTASLGSETADSCGPCTDSAISRDPVTKPARNGDIVIGALPGTPLVYDAAAIATEIDSGSEFIATDASLIPVKTTTLLI
jgi:hypothetical protein